MLKQQISSLLELRTGYIETYKALLDERDIEKRRKILDDWRQYAKRFFE